MTSFGKNKSKLFGYKSCIDILGDSKVHGQYFVPPLSACNRCECADGIKTNCIAIQCQKPKCKNYKQVPGKCCDYTCPSNGIPDTKTLAVVVTLSVMLLFIIIAIVVVWRKMRRKKRFGKRLETMSNSSTQQETDIDSEIKRNSVPNNLRHHRQQQQQLLPASPHSSSSVHSPPLCSSKNYKKDCNIRKKNSFDSGHKSSSPRTPELRAGALLNQHEVVAKQHEVVACCKGDACCNHTTRRFEPPPPYSPPQSLTFV